MHGHGYAPPPQRPSSAQLVGLRVLFVTLALISCGLLSWAPLLRLAIVTRAVRDWVLFAGSAFLMLVSLMLIGNEPTDDLDTFQENLGLFGLLGGAVAAIAYYLFAEIRHFAKQPYAPFVPPQGPHAPGPHAPGPHASGPHAQAPHVAPPAYGYPAQPGPAQQVTRPTDMPQPGPQQGPGPQRPGPARIDQVRAELDELSSLLRQDGTRPDGTHPHGTQPPGGRDGRAEGETR